MEKPHHFIFIFKPILFHLSPSPSSNQPIPQTLTLTELLPLPTVFHELLDRLNRNILHPLRHVVPSVVGYVELEHDGLPRLPLEVAQLADAGDDAGGGGAVEEEEGGARRLGGRDGGDRG